MIEIKDSRKSYKLEDTIEKLLAGVEEYAHGWLKVPSKSGNGMYEVHMDMRTLEAESCDCRYSGRCVHKIVAERYYEPFKNELLREKLISVRDSILDEIIACRWSRLTNDEQRRYFAKKERLKAKEAAKRAAYVAIANPCCLE